MANETKKIEGPVCACGRPDLYEESLKLKGKGDTEDSDSTTADKTKEDIISDDDSGSKYNKPVQGKK
jgi:hypothetical protein